MWIVCPDCLAAVDADVYWPPYRKLAILARWAVFAYGRHFHLNA
jgi:hypothetical protein